MWSGSVLLITGVCRRLLQQVSILELVIDPALEIVERVVQPKVVDQDREQQGVLHYICHQACFVISLG